MGWGIANNTNIWGAESNPNKYRNKEGLALCCRDIDFVLIWKKNYLLYNIINTD